MISLLARLWNRFWLLAGGVTIRVKIMGIVLLVVLALGLAVAWYVKNNVASSLNEELELRGTSIGNGLATYAANYVLTDDLFELYRVSQNALGSDKDIRYVYIQDSKGRVLVHTFSDGFPTDLLGTNRPGRGAAHAVTLDTEEGKLVDVAVPVLEGEAGSVHVGLSTASAEAAVDEHIRFVLIATPLVLVPGLALAYLMATIITRALAGVVRTANAVGRGDFSQHAPVWARDEIGQLAVAFNDMTDRLSLSREQLLRRARDLSILNATGHAASRSFTLDEMLKGVLDSVCDLMDVHNGRLCLYGGDGRLVPFLYHHGPPSVLLREEPLPESMLCPCTEMPATAPAVETTASQRCPLGGMMDNGTAPGAGSSVCFSLRAKDKPQGFLHLARQSGPSFSAEDVQLLAGVSEQLALAVENARLWEDLREREETKGRLLDRIIAAQEDERRRVAQELHDEAGQALTSLLVELRALELTGDRESVAAKASSMRILVADSLRTVQNIALDLRPSVLDDMGLVHALRRYTQDYATRYGLEVDFQTAGLEELRFQPAAETAIYRVVQEALTNVARHAEARRVGVLLTRRSDDLVAIVEDDGEGFDALTAMAQPKTSLGIRGMEERAALVGGRLSVESEPGVGTTVFVEMPLAGNALVGAADA